MKPTMDWGLLRDFALALSAALRKAEAKGGCCEIPETDCPPRCAGSITWTFGRGVLPTAKIVVRNTGSAAHRFDFTATALVGAGVGQAAISVSPASANLAPGATVVVTLQLEDSLDLIASHEYHAEFLFTGTWERSVKIQCRVTPDESNAHELSQGDTPPGVSSVKAHFEKDPNPGAIVWHVQRGMTPEAHLALRNTGTAAKTFLISTTPLLGVNAGSAQLSVSSSSIELAPRETTILELRLNNTASLSPHQEYQAALLVEAFREQRITIHCFIKPDPVAYLEVSQGDFPKRIRAHHWYDHFQCTTPCTQALANEAGPPAADG